MIPGVQRISGLDLTEDLRSLRLRAGTGVSGNRNEFLRALVADFGDLKADSVMPNFNKFAEVFANAELRISPR